MQETEFSDPIVQIFSKDTAMIGFIGAGKVVLKDGKELEERGAITYVWKKINQEWKIVNIHESKKEDRPAGND